MRENAFLVAAVSLPVVLVGVFLAAAAVPRWLVAPPAYDLLLRVGGPYDQTRPRVAVDFTVRAGRVEATARAVPTTMVTQPSTLLLFDHLTMNVREIPVPLPSDLVEGDPPRTIVIEMPAGRQVLAQAKAPDGYALEVRSRRGPGLVGELFGMNRYDEGSSLVKKGRVIPIVLPSQYRYQTVSAVGWLTDQAQR